jgi:hypothetical protein
MLERATGFQPNVGEGRFMVHARHQQHPWTSASNPIVMPKGEAGPTMPWFGLAPARATSLRLLAPPGKLRLGKPPSLAGSARQASTRQAAFACWSARQLSARQAAGEGRIPPATRMSPST